MGEHTEGFDPRVAADNRWAIILAGGDGKRLLPLTRKLSGDDGPKQFCRVLGNETLLDQTLNKVERIVSPDRTFSVVTKAHESFYRQHNMDARGAGLLVQPHNRGTSLAITYSLVCLREIDPGAVVGFFPSDHHFADDGGFSDCVRQAFEFAESHPDAVTLLGIVPNQPDTDYGWIEPGEPLTADGPGLVCGVRRFWEMPSSEVAVELMCLGCYWNTFIMVGRVTSFLALVGRAAPYLYESFQSIVPALFTNEEEASVLGLYLSIPSGSFSADVLSVCPDNLAVLCSKTLEWADVGGVGRALSLMGRERMGVPRRMKISREREPARIPAAAG